MQIRFIAYKLTHICQKIAIFPQKKENNPSTIKTDDGVYIHIRNCGLITMTRGENGAPGFYFRTAPKFEAPQDSPYDWLNNAIFVCMPGPATDCICLRVWKVL